MKNQKKILIADDSPNIRDILKANLEIHGYEVLTSEDGEETLNVIHGEHPDLVILDIMMPKKNGFQICRQIKSEEGYRDIPIIILTARDQKEDRYWSKNCGADEYVVKPFITSELERLAEKYLERGGTPAIEKVSLEELVKMKMREKKPFVLCKFELDPKASIVFEQKYGEIRYSEMIEKVQQVIEEQASKQDAEMVLEQESETKFALIMEGEKEKLEMTIAKIKTRVNDLLKNIYDEEDSRKGFIISRDIKTGQEEKIPLLSIQADLSFPVN
ncbi:MAG: response regulator [Acidobacteriota bacterium]